MSSPTEKRVLAQDRAQYEQSIKAARQRENKKIEDENKKAQKQYEADLKKYEAEKAAYDKQLAAYQNSAQGQFDLQTKQVTDKIKALEAQRAKDLNDAHYAVWGPGGSRNRSELTSVQNQINKQYNSKVGELSKQQNALSNYYNFSVAYPNQPIPTSVLRTVQRSGNQTSLIDTFERYQTGKQAKYERDVQSSVQNAVNAPRYTPQQTAAIQADHVNVLGLTGEGTIGAQERAANIKTEAQNASAVVFPFVPTMAEKTRAPLINVKTGEYDSKGRWVDNNPVALVKGLTKPQVREGVTIMSEKIQGKDGSQASYTFQGMTITEPSAVTLIDFQQGLKTTNRVSPTIYKGILEEKGLPLTPLSKRIIDVYSTKGKYLGYEEPVQAKGKKAVYTNPLTGKSFDSQTGMGDVVIGKQLGFVFDSNMPKPENFVGKTFEGSLGYNLKPKVQGPQQPKLEEAKGFLSLEDAVQSQRKQSDLGLELERGFNQLTSEAETLRKNKPSSNPLLAAYQTVAPLGLAAGRSIYASLGFAVDVSEQYVNPFVREKLGLESQRKTLPVQIRETSGSVVIPYQFQTGRLDMSFDEWKSRQSQYIKQFGEAEYVSGLVFDYGGLKGGSSLLKSPRSLLRLKAPVKTPKIVVPVGGSRSGVWDASEKTVPTIQKKGKKISIPQIGRKQEKLTEPNPFGKERRIPYAINQLSAKVSSGMIATKDTFANIGSKTKRMIINEGKSPNLTQIKSRNQYIPNITKPEPTFSKVDAIGTSLGIAYQKNIKPFLGNMGKIYRQDIPSTPNSFTKLDAAREKFKIGVFKTKESLPALPKVSRPRFMTNTKKGIKGYVFMQKKRFGAFKESLPKPTLPKISFESKAARKLMVSSEINLFKQRESLKESRNALSKLLDQPVTPKAIVPKVSSNFLGNIKRLGGVKEPFGDFVSKLKPFQKAPDFSKDWKYPVQTGPIVKVKRTGDSFKNLVESGYTRQEKISSWAKGKFFIPNFAKQRDVRLPTFGRGTKQQRVWRNQMRSLQKITPGKQSPIGKIKGGKGMFESLVREGYSRQEKINQWLKQKKTIPTAKQGDIRLFKPKIKSVIPTTKKGNTFFDAIKGSYRTVDTNKEIVSRDIIKQFRVNKLRKPDALRSSPISPDAPTPIIKMPKIKTDTEKIFDDLKKQPSREINWKLNESDESKVRYVKDLLKDNKKYVGVGIATTGTLALTPQAEEAHAMPFGQALKIVTPTIRTEIKSGGQILVQRERPKLLTQIKTGKPKPEEKINLGSLIKPITIYKPVQTFKVDNKVTQNIKQTPKVSIALASPQKLTYSTVQKPQQRERQKSREKYIQVSRVVITPKQTVKQSFKYAVPTLPKAPVKLSPRIAQPPKLVQKQLLRTPEKTPRRLPVALAFPQPENKIPKSVKKKQKARDDFLGHSSEVQIGGLFKRKEITYGDKKISRLLQGDVRVVKGKSRNIKRTQKQQYDMLGFKTRKGRKTKDDRFW